MNFMSKISNYLPASTSITPTLAVFYKSTTTRIRAQPIAAAGVMAITGIGLLILFAIICRCSNKKIKVYTPLEFNPKVDKVVQNSNLSNQSESFQVKIPQEEIPVKRVGEGSMADNGVEKIDPVVDEVDLSADQAVYGPDLYDPVLIEELIKQSTIDNFSAAKHLDDLLFFKKKTSEQYRIWKPLSKHVQSLKKQVTHNVLKTWIPKYLDSMRNWVLESASIRDNDVEGLDLNHLQKISRYYCSYKKRELCVDVLYKAHISEKVIINFDYLIHNGKTEESVILLNINAVPIRSDWIDQGALTVIPDDDLGYSLMGRYHLDTLAPFSSKVGEEDLVPAAKGVAGKPVLGRDYLAACETMVMQLCEPYWEIYREVSNAPADRLKAMEQLSALFNWYDLKNNVVMALGKGEALEELTIGNFTYQSPTITEFMIEQREAGEFVLKMSVDGRRVEIPASSMVTLRMGLPREVIW